MKRLTSLLLAALLLLSACGAQSQTDPTEAPPPATATPPATTEAPTTTEPETKPAAGVITYPELDYSHHTAPDESRYRTVLGDPAKLRDGGRVFALTLPPAIRTKEFDGLIKDDIWGNDFRSMDVSDVDLSQIDWNYFSFDTDTLWPEELPEGFDPAAILETGKNPGLGIRALHAQDIDGSGVGIAIIDQGLLLSHREYADNLMYYEHIHCSAEFAPMHGPAVASIAVGRSIGTAPGSKLYFIGISHTHYHDDDSDTIDTAIIADAILRVLEINENLPDGEKIRVISISRGYSRGDKGFRAVQDAIAQADAQGVFVITASPDEYYEGFKLMGMERDYLTDPDSFEHWLPASRLSSFYIDNASYSDYLWVPMGSRTYAGSHGDDAYEIGRQGGLSWAVHWISGFYAMCCQVKPDITPTEFIWLAKETAVSVDVMRKDIAHPMKLVINPAAVIEALQEKS